MANRPTRRFRLARRLASGLVIAGLASEVLAETPDAAVDPGSAIEVIADSGGGGGEVEVRIQPPPVQPELPVWITAAGNPETFRLAGKLGTHLLTHLLGQSVEKLTEKIALYRDIGPPIEIGRFLLFLNTAY